MVEGVEVGEVGVCLIQLRVGGEGEGEEGLHCTEETATSLELITLLGE